MRNAWSAARRRPSKPTSRNTSVHWPVESRTSVPPATLRVQTINGRAQSGGDVIARAAQLKAER